MASCNSCGLGRDCFNTRECEEITQRIFQEESEQCQKCGGWGYYADHDLIENHNPADGSCISCPIQVQCEECRPQAAQETKQENNNQPDHFDF